MSDRYKWVRPGTVVTSRVEGLILPLSVKPDKSDIEANPKIKEAMDIIMEAFAERMAYDEVELIAIEMTGLRYKEPIIRS